jgi:hypothetical protein
MREPLSRSRAPSTLSCHSKASHLSRRFATSALILRLFFLECLRLAMQHGLQHRDLEPVDRMFAERMHVRTRCTSCR